MRVLVTGGNGFVGSHVVEALVRRGHEVTCLVRRTSNLKWIRHLKVAYRYGDLRDLGTLVDAVMGADAVLHLAGVVRASRPEGYFMVNLQGTENVLRACERGKVKYFLLMSSLSAAGPAEGPEPLREGEEPGPISSYGMSKLKAERAALARSGTFKVCVFRPPAVYGPRDTETLSFFRWAKRGILPIPARRPGLLSLIYVEDLAEACVMASEARAEGTYFVCHPELTCWEEVGRVVATRFRRKAVPIYLPFPLGYTISLFAEFVGRITKRPPLLSREKVREMASPYWICDPSRAERHFGFRAKVGLREGMERTIGWYINKGWL